MTAAAPEASASSTSASSLPSCTSSSAMASPAMLDLTQNNDDDELTEDFFVEGGGGGDTSEDEQQHEIIGTYNATIVGIRYYSGVAHEGEYVNLRREPSNPYDRNAIRVDNMHGEKVGHIKATQARLLAPIMDNNKGEEREGGGGGGGGGIKLEATIPRKGNAYTLPCTLEIYAVGPSDTIQERVEQLTDTLQTSFRYQSNWTASHIIAASSSVVASIPQKVPKVETKKMDWKTQQHELDKIFDKQSKEQLLNLPDMPFSPADLLVTELLDYQKDGVKWLVKQERNKDRVPFFKEVVEKKKKLWLCDITNCSQPTPPKPIKGGILCDEMGLGKTLQIIALILAERPQQKTGSSATFSSGSLLPSESSLKKKKVQELKDMLEGADLRPAGKTKKILIQQCLEAARDGKFDDLLQSSDASATIVPPGTTAKGAAGISGGQPVSTLIVCPVSVMSNWQQQIETHVKPNTLQVGCYHGAERTDMLPALKGGYYDVLLVSYNTLSAEYRSKFGGKKKSPSDDDGPEPTKDTKRQKRESIFDVAFHRIVLDEAHTIRSSSTNIFKAVVTIEAERKWALTGTPFVNRSSDIHSLLHFLGVEPLANKDIFRRAVTVPMQNGDDLGLTRLRVVMSHVALRRSKGTANLKLPDKSVQLARVDFEEASPHKAVYDSLYGTMRMAFQAVLQDGDSAVKRYTSVFEVLLRLRQSCCSALLVPAHRRESAIKLWQELQGRSEKNNLTAEEGFKLLEKLKGTFSQTDDDKIEVPECAVCLMEMDESQCMILKTCSHIFCEACISRVLSSTRNSVCPLCRQSFQKNDLVNKSLATVAATTSQEQDPGPISVEEEDIGHSPKILALLDAIKTMNSDEKGVVYSQFTSFLDLIGNALKGAGHSFTRLDGSMNAKKRLEAIKAFGSDDDGSPRFIICSLHAAGSGLNLVRGNICFMMDCWWNVAVENQAMDRIHRIGQERDVRVVRFVMKNSVEERIVDLQEAKHLQAKGSLEKLKPEEKRKARLGDLKGLLNLDD